VAKRRRKEKKKPGRYVVPVALAIFVLVLGFNILRLYEKNKALAAREAELNDQYEEQVDRSQELSALEEFTGTLEYIEQVAREKLGLVFDNEIIFKSDDKE